MNTYKKLINNVIIFSLGNLGSKLLTFLLVPLYTYYLSQEEYGVADLVITTVSMLLPVVSLTMYESVIRFVMNKSLSRESVMVNALSLSMLGYGIFLLFSPLLMYFNVLEGNLLFLYLLLLVQMLNQVFAQYTRGIGQSRVFAFNGIITTFFTGTLNVLFLVKFNWELKGYFLSYILAYAVSTLFLLIVAKPLENFSFKHLDKKVIKEFLNYSVPLIPNNLMWWLINSSSRYFINWFVGVGANGLFAVSSKLPAIINIISQVFSQAWQISVFEEYDKNKNTDFYSVVLDIYLSFLLIATSGIVLIVKPLFSTVFSLEYALAWQPVPFLVLGTVFSSMSSFLGTAYTATKKTEGVFKTSIYGGVISLILNLVFIPRLGIVGAGLSSMISFLLLFIIRFFDTRTILFLKVDWKKIVFTLTIINVQTIVLFMNKGLMQETMLNVILFIVLLFINKNVLSVLLDRLLKKSSK